MKTDMESFIGLNRPEHLSKEVKCKLSYRMTSLPSRTTRAKALWQGKAFRVLRHA